MARIYHTWHGFYPGGGEFPLDIVTSVNAKLALSTRQLSSADLPSIEAITGSTLANFKGSEVLAGALATFGGGADVYANKVYDQSGNAKHSSAASASFRGGLIVGGSQRSLGTKQAIGLISTLEPRFLQPNDAATSTYFSFMGGASAIDMVFVCSESVVVSSLTSTHIGTSPANGVRLLITGGSNLTHYLFSSGSTIIQNLAVFSIGIGVNIIRVTQQPSEPIASDKSIIDANGSVFQNNAATGVASGSVSRGPGFFCDSNGGNGFGKSTSTFNEMYVFDGVMTATEWTDLKNNIAAFYA